MSYLYLLLIMVIGLVERWYVQHFLPLDHLGHAVADLPIFVYWIAGIIISVLLYILSKQVNEKVGLIAVGIYFLSPWSVYLENSRDGFILALPFLMLTFLTFYHKQIKNPWKIILLLIGFLGSLYTIWLGGIIVLLLTLIYHPWGKKTGILITLMALMLLASQILHINSFKNDLRQNITLFNNVGLINTVNTYQGELRQTPFQTIGRVVENKYSYDGLHSMFVLLKHLSPATYFTPQEKLLSFSFSPPLYLGFLIPFLFGLVWLLQGNPSRKEWLTFWVLSLPTLTTQYSPDLSMLILVAPLMAFIVGFGLWKLFSSKRRTYMVLGLVTLVVVLSQMVVVALDISAKEPLRLQRSMER